MTVGGSIRRWTGAGLLGLGLLLAAGAQAAEPLQPHYPLSPFRVTPDKPPRPAPDFTLPVSTGGTVHLRSLRPRIVVINFWATWCIPCVAELPELKQLGETFRGEPFTLLTVDVEESPAKVQAFLKKIGLDLPAAYDEDGTLAKPYAIRGLPTTVIVDSDGNMVASVLGSKQWHSDAALAFFRKLLATVPAR